VKREFLVLVHLLAILLAPTAHAQLQPPKRLRPSNPPSVTQGGAIAEPQFPVPPAAQASDHFDPLAATNAYLATVPPDNRARSDAYFGGG